MPVSPNPLLVGWSVLISLHRVRAPRPQGEGSVDHSLLSVALGQLAGHGLGRLRALEPVLVDYLKQMSTIDPEALDPSQALAYWLNAYNAAALIRAAQAQRNGEESVLGMPGSFDDSIFEVPGESLSLDGIEHGKIRRFKDPRIHAALVCGSVSCPTLRREPYRGTGLSEALDRQMRTFLSSGGLKIEPDRGVVRLSRIFRWYGTDFVAPNRMPAVWPVRRRSVLEALRPWMSQAEIEWIDGTRPRVEFSAYDWALGCAIA